VRILARLSRVEAVHTDRGTHTEPAAFAAIQRLVAEPPNGCGRSVAGVNIAAGHVLNIRLGLTPTPGRE
jgi:hypothetical protein